MMIYLTIGRMFIYFVEAMLVCDWRAITRRLIAIKEFYRRSRSAGITHYSAYHLDKELEGYNSILDLGCGKNSWINTISTSYSVGIDAFEPDLRQSRQRGLHSDYILADISELEFKENSFDAVVAFDVIEHLYKDKAIKLIESMSKWARKKVLISTPIGYVPRDDITSNPYARHLSGWNRTELENMGFKVRGGCGIQGLRDHHGNIRYKPELIWQTISSLTSVFLYFVPSLSFSYFCIRTNTK